MLLCVIISIGGVLMNLHITKSKNAESFYIAKSYTKANGKTSSVIVRKLGTLNQLIVEHGPTRDDVLAWAKNEVKLETEKYKKDQQTKAVQITFHSDHKLDYGQQVLYRGGYLFPQTFYYRLKLDNICRKLRDKYKFKYDINAILSDLIYARILEPASKRSSYKTASEFLEKPSYQLHDIYRALDVLGNECDFIQSEVYKTVIFSESETMLSCIMTVQTISLRLSRKMGTENTAKAKNTVLTRSSRWGCLWTVMGYLLLFHFSPATQMNRLP